MYDMLLFQILTLYRCIFKEKDYGSNLHGKKKDYMCKQNK